ncbi:MAG: hypothetical protein A2928_03610 [Candidatus Taylorbacteria bacterium RIFCSPLOWO2_01_FULL_45_15b]|uniref:Uncharacterized protein n=1 Tax=Candidatus Taylorbacteria bacterium RIFCSPLOWO2_01_FULL_45_15b TaxID=1802319 RepID=A0A1G2NED8_9BACT|nr:MAG: hypothetical protein A2928_03610 [Candidatus Taylorbacteria bacterium RIFCSPLOWO2_01_FULL_45_15b]
MRKTSRLAFTTKAVLKLVEKSTPLSEQKVRFQITKSRSGEIRGQIKLLQAVIWRLKHDLATIRGNCPCSKIRPPKILLE